MSDYTVVNSIMHNPGSKQTDKINCQVAAQDTQNIIYISDLEKGESLPLGTKQYNQNKWKLLPHE